MPPAPPAWRRPDSAGGASAPTSRSPSGPPSRVGATPQHARVRPPSRPPLCGLTTGPHRAVVGSSAYASTPEARGAARSARLHCAGADRPGPRAHVRCIERGVAQSSAGRSSSPRRHPRWCDPALTARSPESAASPLDRAPTGTPPPGPPRSDDQQLAPWPASATHGAPAYPLHSSPGIQAESFARNPYKTFLAVLAASDDQIERQRHMEYASRFLVHTYIPYDGKHDVEDYIDEGMIQLAGNNLTQE